MVNIVFKFFIAISCLLIFRGLVAEPLLDGADFDYGEYLSGQCLTCHQNSSDEGIPAINGAEALYIAKKLILYKNKELENEVMQLVASALDKEQIASLAIYFNSLEKWTDLNQKYVKKQLTLVQFYFHKNNNTVTLKKIIEGGHDE